MEVKATAVDIKGLKFQYDEQSGVTFSDFDLQISAGERFGLLGPNGAGKTTLMNLMTGVLKPRQGSIKIMGHEIAKGHYVRKFFGFVPQVHSFYPDLTPLENMQFFGAWSGLGTQEIKQRTDELLEVLGLSGVANKVVSKFSGGMKNRLNLALGIIHKPAIVFLDEPTTAVDVQTRHAIISYLKKINEEGTTLIYTSHMLPEAESLCTQVALIDHGHIIAQNQLSDLLTQYNQTNLENLFLHLTGVSYRDANV